MIFDQLYWVPVYFTFDQLYLTFVYFIWHLTKFIFYIRPTLFDIWLTLFVFYQLYLTFDQLYLTFDARPCLAVHGLFVVTGWQAQALRTSTGTGLKNWRSMQNKSWAKDNTILTLKINSDCLKTKIKSRYCDSQKYGIWLKYMFKSFCSKQKNTTQPKTKKKWKNEKNRYEMSSHLKVNMLNKTRDLAQPQVPTDRPRSACLDWSQTMFTNISK